jgi:Fe-S cluster assembly iron-binding protein IscA
MALDEPNDRDQIQSEDGFSFAIEKELLSMVGGVKVDFQQNRFFGGGFTINPQRAAAGCAC